MDPTPKKITSGKNGNATLEHFDKLVTSPHNTNNLKNNSHHSMTCWLRRR